MTSEQFQTPVFSKILKMSTINHVSRLHLIFVFVFSAGIMNVPKNIAIMNAILCLVLFII